MYRLALVGVSILTLIAAWIGLTPSARPSDPRSAATNRPIQRPEDGYSSSDTCRACHPREYATWHQSYHRTMTQIASSETIRAAFHNVSVTDVHGRPMQLTRNGEQFFAEFDDPDLDARTTTAQRITREVVMVTGSHNQQIYWYATGRSRLLGQLPGAYLIDEQRWIPRRAAVLHAPNMPVFSETGHWNAVCISCHATNGKPEFDTPFGSRPIGDQTVQSRVAEFGIACEACHGPADAHIAKNRNPLRRYQLHLSGAADATTTQPSQLPARLSSQVCGQCHGIWEFARPADERAANSRGLAYRPGAELRDSRLLVQPTRNGDAPEVQQILADDPNFIRDAFWPDGMVRVSGREYNGLIESPCFTHATDESRTLSCFSCHTMHKSADDSRPAGEWANDQLGVGKSDNRACASCHPSIAATPESLTQHTGHPADSDGSVCYNCHMPYTTYGLLKTIRSHTVSSPSVAESVQSGRPNACNLCHLDRTLSWTAAALSARKGARPDQVALTAPDQEISAAALWALTGDAGQRAIVAQAMGWQPAQKASGTAWMTPVLAQLLDDPYDAVRFIAGRALRTTPAFRAFEYDFAAPRSRRYAAQLAAMRMWDAAGRGASVAAPARGAVLLDPEGRLRVAEMLTLLKSRNDRPMLLRE